MQQAYHDITCRASRYGWTDKLQYYTRLNGKTSIASKLYIPRICDLQL
jgi:hypothetical protein